MKECIQLIAIKTVVTKPPKPTRFQINRSQALNRAKTRFELGFEFAVLLPFVYFIKKIVVSYYSFRSVQNLNGQFA